MYIIYVRSIHISGNIQYAFTSKFARTYNSEDKGRRKRIGTETKQKFKNKNKKKKKKIDEIDKT